MSDRHIFWLLILDVAPTFIGHRADLSVRLFLVKCLQCPNLSSRNTCTGVFTSWTSSVVMSVFIKHFSGTEYVSFRLQTCFSVYCLIRERCIVISLGRDCVCGTERVPGPLSVLQMFCQWIWSSGGMTLAGENRRTRRKILPQYHSVHHKFHVDWPGRELGQPRLETRASPEARPTEMVTLMILLIGFRTVREPCCIWNVSSCKMKRDVTCCLQVNYFITPLIHHRSVFQLLCVCNGTRKVLFIFINIWILFSRFIHIREWEECIWLRNVKCWKRTVDLQGNCRLCPRFQE